MWDNFRQSRVWSLDSGSVRQTCWIYFQWKVRPNNSFRIAFDDHRWAWVFALHFRANRGTLLVQYSNSKMLCNKPVQWKGEAWNYTTEETFPKTMDTICIQSVVVIFIIYSIQFSYFVQRLPSNRRIICDHQYYRRYFEMFQLYVNISDALYKYGRLAHMLFSIIDLHRSIFNSVDWQFNTFAAPVANW